MAILVEGCSNGKQAWGWVLRWCGRCSDSGLGRRSRGGAHATRTQQAVRSRACPALCVHRAPVESRKPSVIQGDAAGQRRTVEAVPTWSSANAHGDLGPPGLLFSQKSGYS